MDQSQSMPGSKRDFNPKSNFRETQLPHERGHTALVNVLVNVSVISLLTSQQKNRSGLASFLAPTATAFKKSGSWTTSRNLWSRASSPRPTLGFTVVPLLPVGPGDSGWRVLLVDDPPPPTCAQLSQPEPAPVICAQPLECHQSKFHTFPSLLSKSHPVWGSSRYRLDRQDMPVRLAPES